MCNCKKEENYFEFKQVYGDAAVTMKFSADVDFWEFIQNIKTFVLAAGYSTQIINEFFEEV